MKCRVLLTDKVVAAIKHPGKTKDRRVFFDKKLAAFGVRVSPNGHKAWIVMIRDNTPKRGGKLRQVTLGKYPKMSLREARQAACIVFGKIAHNRLHSSMEISHSSSNRIT